MRLRRLIQSIIIFTMLSSVCEAIHASNREAEEEALRKGFEAAYKQSGVEENINKFVEREVPKKYKEFAGQIAPIAKIFVNKEVGYKWEF
jgi:ribosomal protein S3AE